MLIERGIQNPTTSQNGLWNANLEGSIIILKSWLASQPQKYNIKEFTFSSRFLKLVPLFMHYCGQAGLIEELKDFANDLSIIIARLIGQEIKEPDMLLKYLLNDGNKTHGYLKISTQKKSAVVEVKENAVSLKYPVYLEIIEDPVDEETLLDFKLESFRLILKVSFYF